MPVLMLKEILEILTESNSRLRTSFACHLNLGDVEEQIDTERRHWFLVRSALVHQHSSLRIPREDARSCLLAAALDGLVELPVDRLLARTRDRESCPRRVLAPLHYSVDRIGSAAAAICRASRPPRSADLSAALYFALLYAGSEGWRAGSVDALTDARVQLARGLAHVVAVARRIWRAAAQYQGEEGRKGAH